MSAAIEEVLVYRLYEQRELEERGALLEQSLEAPGPRRPIDPSFMALPGGCFRWEDSARLHGDDASGLLPPNPGAANAAAAAYMRAANEAAARYRQSRGVERSRHPDPFPTATLTPAAARRVRSRKTGRDHHWLTTWSVQLPSTPGPEGGRSSVVGASIELRVAPGGQVVSVVSRVRPWREPFARPCFDMSHEHGEHEDSDSETAIVYVSDNPHEPMGFLAPCWAIPPADEESHHARRLWPACDHTVLPEILVNEQRGEATVSAQVLTGKQEAVEARHGPEWRVRWSVATLAEFIAGERRVREGSSAPLPGPGLYQVELELEHLKTGALRSTHSQIAVAPPQAESRQRRGVSRR